MTLAEATQIVRDALITGSVDTRWSDPENGVIEAVIDVDRFRITVEEIGYPS